jgi:hypothetical protein
VSSETFGGARKALLEKSMVDGIRDGVIGEGGASRRVELLPAAAGRVAEGLWRVKRRVEHSRESERESCALYSCVDVVSCRALYVHRLFDSRGV